MPDTIPLDIVRAHRRMARRTVVRSAPRRQRERWGTRLASGMLVLALVAGLAAAGLMAMAVPPIRLPLAALAALIAVVAAESAWARRKHRRRRNRRPR